MRGACLSTCRYEQLCINYTNEVLQHFFIQSVFVLETKEYERQGLSNWASVPFKDNLDIIDLIAKRPVGILALLDNQTLLGERGTDAAFVASVKREHGKAGYDICRGRWTCELLERSFVLEKGNGDDGALGLHFTKLQRFILWERVVTSGDVLWAPP